MKVSDANEKMIRALPPSSDWYSNDLKNGVVWSLEMMDTKNPCSGFSNQTAGKDNSGGRPGIKF